MRASEAARTVRKVTYPESDGKPMAETEHHRIVMSDTIEGLSDYYADNPRVHVGGNLMMFYEQGNPRKHVSPDVFLSKKGRQGKLPKRRTWLVWEEGAAPDLVMEITSKKTRKEDLVTKMALYRDVLKVKEYFLFDPYEEYLKPSLQGYRLQGGQYVPIKSVKGRLPSKVLRLHLERDGEDLRLYNPKTKQRLLTRKERAQQEALARQQAEARAQQEATARQQAEAEIERLRRELDELRRPPRSP
jgi:Uma2 family endonuclease